MEKLPTKLFLKSTASLRKGYQKEAVEKNSIKKGDTFFLRFILLFVLQHNTKTNVKNQIKILTTTNNKTYR